MNIADLERNSVSELQAIELGIVGYSKMRKKDLILEILRNNMQKEGLLFAEGILEVLPDGFGFLRVGGMTPSPDDIYVSPSQIRRFNMRKGDLISGQVRPPKDGEKYFALLRVEAINSTDPEIAQSRMHFEDLTPLYPADRLRLKYPGQHNNAAHRSIDSLGSRSAWTHRISS